MSSTTTKILLVEDNPGDARLIQEMLAETDGAGFEIDWVPQLSVGLERLGRGKIDLVLLDLGLPDSRGLDTFVRAYAQAPQIPFVVLTGLDDETLALSAVRQGAQDYLVKGQTDGHLLLRAIRYATERKRIEEELRLSNEELRREIEVRRAAELAVEAERQRLYALLDGLPGMVHLKTADFSIQFANRFFRETFGDWEGKCCFELMMDRTEPCENCPALSVFQNWLPTETEWTVPKTKQTYQIHHHPFADVGGPPMVLTLGIDITQRKRAEEALEAERQRLYSLLDGLPGLVYLKAPDYSLRFANRLFREICGDWEGKKCFEAIFKREQPCENCTQFSVLKTGEPSVKEATYAESKRTYQVYSYPFADVDGSSLVLTLGIDITERQQAEEEIRLNEARLASLVRISQYHAESIQELLDFALEEAITLTGSKIGYIYLYDELTQQFTLNTWSKEVMQECTIAEPQTVYQLEKTGIWGEAVRQARPIMVNEFQAPNPLKKGYPEGHAALYKYLTTPVFSSGRIVAVVAVANKASDYEEADVRQLTLMMDAVWKITERKQAEEDLRQSEAQLAEAQRIAHLGHWDFNPQSGEVIWSEELYRIYGLNPENFTPSLEAVNNLIHPEDAAQIKQRLEEALAGGRPYNVVYRTIRPNGSVRYIHSQAEVICDESGRPQKILGTAQDITERRKAEIRLRASEERFRAIFEGAALGIVMSNLEGRIMSANAAQCRMLGYQDDEELRGKTFFEITHPEDQGKSSQLFSDLKTGLRDEYQLEKRFLRQDGSDFWAQVTVSLVRGPEGEPRCCIGTTEDITERKDASEKLQESEQRLRILASQLMTAQEDERKRISQELHDELGQSLLVLKLQAGYIERELGQEQQQLRQECQEMLANFDKTVENVRRLSRDLSPTIIEDLGLSAALHHLIGEFSKHYHIECRTQETDIDDLFPLATQIAIYRIVQESLTNIGKHSQAHLLQISIDKSDHQVSFLIQDSGQGFDPAKQLSQRRGMGLASMEERARMVGGTLSIWSQKGAGTKISLVIPYSAKPE